MGVSAHIREAWRINDRVNQVLLEHLIPEMLRAQTPGGGFSVLQHLAHLTEAKKFWGAMLDEQLSTLPNLVDEKRREEGEAETDLSRIEAVTQQTTQKILESVEHADSKGDSPYRSVEVFLVHLIAHDAHHRGQILLALETAGHPLPSEGALWGLWREA